jgi:hypothetical protein
MLAAHRIGHNAAVMNGKRIVFPTPGRGPWWPAQTIGQRLARRLEELAIQLAFVAKWA